MNLFENEKQQNPQNTSLSNTTDSSKRLMQEMSQKLKESLWLNQKLSKANQKLQEELQSVLTNLSDTTRLNRQLSIENDNLRNRGGWMLREKEKKLEKENADVRAQNSKLESLVEMSKVEAYEKAIEERDAALESVEAEKKKVIAIQKASKAELSKANKNAKKAMDDLKNKIQFWQIVSGGTLVIGMLLGWMI